MDQEIDSVPLCPWCGNSHPNTICNMVKSIEYYANGKIKKVEFKVAGDYLSLTPPYTGPTFPQQWNPNPSFGITTVSAIPNTVSGTGISGPQYPSSTGLTTTGSVVVPSNFATSNTVLA